MLGTNDFEVARLFALCEAELSAAELSIEPTVDFASAEKRMRALRKTSFTPMLSSQFHDLSKDDAFWLFLQRDGRDVAGVAARRDYLNSESLSSYWHRSYLRMYSSDGTEVSIRHAHPALREIKGCVAYLGEFYFLPDERGSRNTMRILSHLLFAYCFIRWKPDWQYAFIRKKDVERGYASVYGFTLQIPGAQTWVADVPNRSSGEYLVAIRQADLFHMAGYYTANPQLFLGEDALTSVEKLRT
ncbi:hypothetical protein TRL7639_01406 [Falsiruegeria litorea R37]|uniref:GNAT family N-acetyltransferase n=1 Tax=Falsiruegeria litorea R37 TaxID=1200284 RepID=A0A1Y5S507_9RHOB|nr:hypothetical protein [Falsiruegeria litorea]SLN32286.1 hypothetical protein TRL7639_01406 [Falsiruegeria litorea R37]